MINLITIIATVIILLISNYTAFGYGVRIGKAMQKEIPDPPLVEPARKFGKKLLKLAKPDKIKSYYMKKEDKEEIGMFD